MDSVKVILVLNIKKFKIKLIVHCFVVEILMLLKKKVTPLHFNCKMFNTSGIFGVLWNVGRWSALVSLQ